MKVVFFCVVLANIAFFMWEYNRNAVEQAKPPDTSVQQSIVLVDELNERPSASREGDSVAEIASNQFKGIEGREAGSDNKEIADLANENSPPLNVGRELSGGRAIAPQDESVSGKKGKSALSTPSPMPAETAAADLGKEPQRESPQSATAGHAEASWEERQFCVEAGPFTDEKLINQWNRELSTAHAQIQLQTRTVQSQSVGDYLVYQPAAETPEQSDADLKMIKNQGFADAWTIKESEGKGKIVLGVFKKEERAVAMKEQLQAKGIYAEVMPRYKKQLQKYVLINGQGPAPESITILRKNYPGITLKPATTCVEP